MSTDKATDTPPQPDPLLALRLTEGLGPLPEPAFGWLSVSGNDGRWTESATGERAFDAEQMRAYAGAAVAAERERWRVAAQKAEDALTWAHGGEPLPTLEREALDLLRPLLRA